MVNRTDQPCEASASPAATRDDRAAQPHATSGRTEARPERRGTSSPAADQSAGPAEPSSAPSERRRQSLFPRIEKTAAFAAALIGALAGAVAVVDWADGLGGEPPPQIDAHIVRVTSRDVAEPLRLYLSETSQSLHGYSKPQLEQRGSTFNVSVRIIGQRGKKFPVRWTLYRRDPETRIEGRAYNQIAGDMRPASNDHASTWPVWVPYPPRAGTYFVRFTLEDQRRRPVSEKDSQPFRYPPR